MAGIVFAISTAVGWPPIVMTIISCLDGGQYVSFEFLQIVSTRRTIKDLRLDLRQLCAVRNEDLNDINFEMKTKFEPECCRSVLLFRFKRIYFIEIKTVEFDDDEEEQQSVLQDRGLPPINDISATSNRSVNDQNYRGQMFDPPSVETGASGPSNHSLGGSVRSHQEAWRATRGNSTKVMIHGIPLSFAFVNLNNTILPFKFISAMVHYPLSQWTIISILKNLTRKIAMKRGVWVVMSNDSHLQ